MLEKDLIEYKRIKEEMQKELKKEQKEYKKAIKGGYLGSSGLNKLPMNEELLLKNNCELLHKLSDLKLLGYFSKYINGLSQYIVENYGRLLTKNDWHDLDWRKFDRDFTIYHAEQLRLTKSEILKLLNENEIKEVCKWNLYIRKELNKEGSLDGLFGFTD